MSVERITPDRAHERMNQGWTYVDVRSEPEFEAGHPQGAYNVPFMHRGGPGLVANPDFVAVMTRHFAKDQAIIVGCRSGGRSLQAARALIAAGYSNIVDMRGGFVAEAGPGGAVTCPGWQSRDLPVATEAETGRSYRELQAGA